MTMSCSVTYYGFWAPRMQWSLLGGSNRSSVDVTTNATVTSILTINTTSGMDGQQYICRTFFSQQSLSTVTASNIPAYSYTWTTRSLKAYGNISLLRLTKLYLGEGREEGREGKSKNVRGIGGAIQSQLQHSHKQSSTFTTNTLPGLNGQQYSLI